jgi:hypothetical protein
MTADTVPAAQLAQPLVSLLYFRSSASMLKAFHRELCTRYRFRTFFVLPGRIIT